MPEPDGPLSSLTHRFNVCVDGAAFPADLWAHNFAVGFETRKNPGGLAQMPALPEGVSREFLASKAHRDIDVNQTALAYTRGIVDKADAFRVRGTDGKESTYSRVDAIDDKTTGFSGAIYMNEKGHALVLYQGMAARTDPQSSTADVTAYWQAEEGRVDNQALQARDLYIRAAEIGKSVETIGFSLGTVHTNMLAALYGAKATNMSNIGLSKLYATPEGIANVQKNVVSMRIEGDNPPSMPTKYLGMKVGGYGDGRLFAGKVYNDEKMLPAVSAQDTICEVDKLSPQNARFFDPKTYPCSGGEQHTSEAYVLAQERAAVESKLPQAQLYNIRDLMAILK